MERFHTLYVCRSHHKRPRVLSVGMSELPPHFPDMRPGDRDSVRKVCRIVNVDIAVVILKIARIAYIRN